MGALITAAVDGRALKIEPITAHATAPKIRLVGPLRITDDRGLPKLLSPPSSIAMAC